MRTILELEYANHDQGIRSWGIHGQYASTIYIQTGQTETNQAICFLYECLAIWNRWKKWPAAPGEDMIRWKELQALAAAILNAGSMTRFFLRDKGDAKIRYTVHPLKKPVEEYHYKVLAECCTPDTGKWYEIPAGAYFRTREEAEAYKDEKIRQGSEPEPGRSGKEEEILTEIRKECERSIGRPWADD